MDFGHGTEYEMKDEDYYKFIRFQKNIFTTLQERGFYLRGVSLKELDMKEIDRLANLAYKQWQELLEFEKV